MNTTTFFCKESRPSSVSQPIQQIKLPESVRFSCQRLDLSSEDRAKIFQRQREVRRPSLRQIQGCAYCPKPTMRILVECEFSSVGFEQARGGQFDCRGRKSSPYYFVDIFAGGLPIRHPDYCTPKICCIIIKQTLICRTGFPFGVFLGTFQSKIIVSIFMCVHLFLSS